MLLGMNKIIEIFEKKLFNKVKKQNSFVKYYSYLFYNSFKFIPHVKFIFVL